VIKLPDVGEGIAEAEIVAWHIAVGDELSEDAVFVEVMTDKATVELPSPVSGRIVRLGGEVGDVLAVGSGLAWVDVVGDAAELGEPVVDDGGQEPVVVDSGGAPVAEVASPSPSPSLSPSPSPAPAEPPAMRAAEPQPPGSVEPSDGTHAAGARAQAAPAVRRRARDLGIDLGEIVGTGPEGRVEHADLDAYLTARTARPVRAPASPAEAVRDEIEAVKVVGLRRNIAQRMQEAHARIPHFTYVEELDLTEAERLRSRLNDQWGDERPRLTLLPFLMRAVVIAVGEHPEMNARFDDEAGIVHRHRSVHLGIAVQTPRGLMVPVVKDAQRLDLWESATEVSRLSDAARASTVSLEELSGSTITITSLGALGGLVSTPVINRPEVAIIGVNKLVDRPVLVDGTWIARRMMNLSSSFDHRVIDGWDAARFIQRIKALLETPATLFV